MEDLFYTLYDHQDIRAWKLGRRKAETEETGEEWNYYKLPKPAASPNVNYEDPSSAAWRERYGTSYRKR